MSKERLHIKQRGFSLVEVMLASSVFILLVTALVGAWLYGQESTVLAGNRAQAVLLAEEGLEAVRNIRDGSSGVSSVSDGTYGLSIASNQWNLSGSSDTVNIFTRQIVISTIDAKRKSVTANVTWQQNPQRTGSVSLPSELTAWQCADQATLLTVNTSAASLTGVNRNIVGITVANSGVGCGDIVIDKITVSWTPTAGNRMIENILASGLSVWTGSGDTGTVLDITDTVLISSASAASTEYRFSNNMNNRVFAIVYTMGDGSVKSVSGIVP